jgi:hypothetical protein
MLVLTRKSQEAVVVGGSEGFERMLKVTVLEINGTKVRLGFEVDKASPSIAGRCGNASSLAANQTPRRQTLHLWRRCDEEAIDVSDLELKTSFPGEGT